MRAATGTITPNQSNQLNWNLGLPSPYKVNLLAQGPSIQWVGC